MTEVKFSDLFADVLVELGFTHCFLVAGGNIMHLIESLSARLTMVPVINEVATVIAAEYFNEVNREKGKKALALVTAGPGLTNAMTGIAGAFSESREVLIVGGQVKRSDLSRGSLRQKGIQEVDGLAIASPVCIRSIRLEEPTSRKFLTEFISQPECSRRGPVFIELCLDTQNTSTQPGDPYVRDYPIVQPNPTSISNLLTLLESSSRPVLLLGSGVRLDSVPALVEDAANLGIPILSTWNAADRVRHDHPIHFGRPNNWGQRHSNLILQQCDLLIAAGTRLGFQQTGFNYQEFCPLAKIVHIDLDIAEVEKGHPRVDLPIIADAALTLQDAFSETNRTSQQSNDWLHFCDFVKQQVPVPDPANTADSRYVELFEFVHKLSDYFGPNDIVIPCSSGGGSTATMQVIKQKGLPQRIITNKGMASMGYGLPGAIGSCFARPDSKTWLVDGDGGIIQNLQEFGVVARFGLPLKTFIISNNGYASIRSTQRNYFGGHYVGCDPATGLHLPNWKLLSDTYGIRFMRIDPENPFSDELEAELQTKRPGIFEIPVDPEQTFYPKIQSQISIERGMISNPLHEMYPPLDAGLDRKVKRYLNERDQR